MEKINSSNSFYLGFYVSDFATLLSKLLFIEVYSKCLTLDYLDMQQETEKESFIKRPE